MTDSQPAEIANEAALTRKQREIRQRAARILDTAYPIIRRDGLAGVNMDAIARQMNLTRGTIYNHFPNKEDVLLALAARAVGRRMSLFHRAATLGRTHRDSCAGIGIAAEVYVDHLPDDFAIEQAIRHDSVWQKTSPGRRDVLAACEAECIGSIGNLVSAAIHAGDLVVPRGTRPAELTQRIVFGLWSLVYGGLVIESTSPSLAHAGIGDARHAIRRNCGSLLDDVGWQPLYDARKTKALVRRIQPALVELALELQQQDSP